MNYQVIARKWRPQSFAEVVGQQHVTRTLANAVQSGRVAHAYIFSGARGVGKTTTARILAKALNCAKGPAAEPCNQCDSCREIAAGNSLDVMEIDAASNRGIDQIRELREMVRYAPAGGRYRVVILDEAHMLTDEASNALLKTLEEPPDKVIFVMATTEPDELPETIRSRSQHFHFRALSFAEITAALREICAKENLTAEPGALAVIARAAEGSVRDALSLLEQARAYCGEHITDAQVRQLLGVVSEEILDELIGAVEAQSAERVLNLVHRLVAEGQNLQHFCREAIGHFRNLLVARVCGSESELIAAPADRRAQMAQSASIFGEEDLTRFFRILLHTDEDLRRKPDERLHLEMGLLRLVNAARLVPLEEVLAELDSEPSTGAARNPARSATANPQTTIPVRGAVPASFGGGASRTSVGTAFSSAAAASSATAAPSPSVSTPAAPRPQASAVQSAPAPSAPSVRSAAAPASPAAVAPAAEDLSTENAGASRAAEKIDGKTEEIPSREFTTGGGLDAVQVNAIKSAILAQEQFLGELIEHVSRWELHAGELRLFFPLESRALADMLQSRDAMERLRNIAARVLAQSVRVCVKLEDKPAMNTRAASGTHELRARFEQDPIVRGMLERFGGQISEVKHRSED